MHGNQCVCVFFSKMQLYVTYIYMLNEANGQYLHTKFRESYARNKSLPINTRNSHNSTKSYSALSYTRYTRTSHVTFHEFLNQFAENVLWVFMKIILKNFKLKLKTNRLFNDHMVNVAYRTLCFLIRLSEHPQHVSFSISLGSAIQTHDRK